MADQFRLVLPLGLCLAAVGCGGGKMGTVEGRVTLDGQPLAGAMVQFQPKEGGRPSAAKTDEQGYYRLLFSQREDGALVGQHVVQISTYGEDEDEQGRTVIIKERVPAKYNAKSELVREVKSGSNEINFELQSGSPIAPPPAGGGERPAAGCCCS